MIYVLAFLLPPLGLLLNGQPFSAVFYPVAVLPPAAQAVAFAIPASHVVEGMRAVLDGQGIDWSSVGVIAVLVLVPSIHGVVAVHMKREDRRHREIVEAIERHGPPPGYRS